MDKQLIHRVKSGDREACKSIYLLTCDRLMILVRRYCHDMQDAQDILQNTYVKLYGNISSFDPNKGQFLHWLKRIAINETFQYLKKRKKLGLSPITELESEVVEINIDALTVNELKQCISKLRTEYKVILNLYYFDQYSHKEIGEILNIKESSSRSKLTRAKSELLSHWEALNTISTYGK